jgi:putative acyl-CoA dehydrogenase
LALLLQADLLLRFAPAAVAEAFCRTRLSDDAYAGYGCLPAGVDIAALLERAAH